MKTSARSTGRRRERGERVLGRLAVVARAAGVCVCIISSAVLVGWCFDIEWLTRARSGLIAVRPLAAVALFVSGVALCALAVTRRGHGAGTRWAARLAGAGVASLGAARLVAFHLSHDAGPDPNQIPPNGALAFLLVGSALACATGRSRRADRLKQTMAISLGVLALTALLGYVYGVPEFYQVPSAAPMPLYSTIAFVLCAAALLLVRPRSGLGALLAGDSAGGVLLRRLLPALVVLSLVFGWLERVGTRAGLYRAEFGVVLGVTAGMLVAAALTWWTALLLHRTDLRHRRDERRARAANRSRSELLAMVSHEIRTPITAIVGYAELLATTPRHASTSDLHAAWARTIHESGERLAGVVDDILDLSKMDAGQLTVRRTECSPREIIDGVVNLLSHRVREKGLRLSVDYRPDAPRHIVCDAQRVRQILINLVGNALKFTDAGGIAVSVSAAADQTGTRVCIDVSDTGVGIDEEDRRLLFEPFVQGRNHARVRGGTGLGLTISRKLARLMGGDVSVRSTRGSGSTFTLHLPTTNGTGTGANEPLLPAVAAVRRAA